MSLEMPSNLQLSSLKKQNNAPRRNLKKSILMPKMTLRQGGKIAPPLMKSLDLIINLRGLQKKTNLRINLMSLALASQSKKVRTKQMIRSLLPWRNSWMIFLLSTAYQHQQALCSGEKINFLTDTSLLQE